MWIHVSFRVLNNNGIATIAISKFHFYHCQRFMKSHERTSNRYAGDHEYVKEYSIDVCISFKSFILVIVNKFDFRFIKCTRMNESRTREK